MEGKGEKSGELDLVALERDLLEYHFSEVKKIRATAKIVKNSRTITI